MEHFSIPFVTLLTTPVLFICNKSDSPTLAHPAQMSCLSFGANPVIFPFQNRYLTTPTSIVKSHKQSVFHINTIGYRVFLNSEALF